MQDREAQRAGCGPRLELAQVWCRTKVDTLRKHSGLILIRYHVDCEFVRRLLLVLCSVFNVVLLTKLWVDRNLCFLFWVGPLALFAISIQSPYTTVHGILNLLQVMHPDISHKKMFSYSQTLKF